MKAFLVEVESKDRRVDWTDNFVVIAEDGEEARELALREAWNSFPDRSDFDPTDALEITGTFPRVVGRLVPDDEA